MSVDSSQLDPRRLGPDRRGGQLRPSGADGVVITHGTDTMEETALWLELTYDGAAPVVLTGAHAQRRRPRRRRAGQPARRAGGGGQRGRRGTSACWSAWRGGLATAGLQKVATADLSGFAGVAVGSVADGRFGPTSAKERPFLGALSAVDAPRVDIVAVYPGGDAVAMDACVAAGARGIVLEALGSGNAGDAVDRRRCGGTVATA